MSAKRGRNVHVVPSKAHPGKFVVKAEGSAKPVTRPATQAKSITKAIPIAKHNKSEVVIHRANGQIRDKDSYGPDPFPPRDTKH